MKATDATSSKMPGSEERYLLGSSQPGLLLYGIETVHLTECLLK